MLKMHFIGRHVLEFHHRPTASFVRRASGRCAKCTRHLEGENLEAALCTIQSANPTHFGLILSLPELQPQCIPNRAFFHYTGFGDESVADFYQTGW